MLMGTGFHDIMEHLGQIQASFKDKKKKLHFIYSLTNICNSNRLGMKSILVRHSEIQMGSLPVRSKLCLYCGTISD